MPISAKKVEVTPFQQGRTDPADPPDLAAMSPDELAQLLDDRAEALSKPGKSLTLLDLVGLALARRRGEERISFLL